MLTKEDLRKLGADKVVLCSLCGRALKDPESRKRKIGPECLKRLPTGEEVKDYMNLDEINPETGEMYGE